MTAQMYFFIAILLTPCISLAPLVTMQRAIRTAREAQIPWKHCLARMAAITLTQALLQKTYKNTACPKTPEEWQKLKEVLQNINPVHESPEDTKFFNKTASALLMLTAAFTLHNATLTYFDQRLMATPPSWRHQAAYGAHNLTSRFLLGRIEALLPAKLAPFLAAAKLSNRYYGPLAIDRRFIGKSAQMPLLRLIGIAQEYAAETLVAKII